MTPQMVILRSTATQPVETPGPKDVITTSDRRFLILDAPRTMRNTRAISRSSRTARFSTFSALIVPLTRILNPRTSKNLLRSQIVPNFLQCYHAIHTQGIHTLSQCVFPEPRIRSRPSSCYWPVRPNGNRGARAASHP